MKTRIRCQVLEVSAHDDRRSRGRSDWPRDLLPWADPYIAGLVRRLEDRYAAAEEADEPVSAYSADDVPPDGYDDGWEDDAFMPRQLEPTRLCWYPPIYGGFPLLDDRE